MMIASKLSNRSTQVSDQPLRVLITTPNLDSAGMKYVIADLVKGFDRDLIQPSLCVHRRSETTLENEVVNSVEQFFELPLRIPARPLSRLWQDCRTIAQQFFKPFDIVHSFDYASSWTEGLAARMAGVPWFIEKTNMSWGGYRWWVRCALAKCIICLSETQRTTLFAKSLFKRKTKVIHTGVDLTRFNAAEVNSVTADLGIPANSIVLGCVAHLVPVKGHPELLRAFAEIVEDYRSTYLVLVGGGEKNYETTLKELANKLGIAHKVKFLGIRSDVPQLLSTFDGLILPTRNWGRKEAFGAVLVEAMACGLPVIATKSGGPEDIVVPGKTGWLVNAQGHEPLVSALREFLANENLRNCYGQAGRERAFQRFSKQLMVEKYQNTYLQLASSAS